MKKLNFILIFMLIWVLNMKAQLSSGDNEVYLAKVEVEGSPAIIDLSGNYVVRPGIYEAIYFDRFSEGLCPVKRNGKEGFIDIYGNEVIPCIWRWVWKFERGLASVGVDYGDGYNLLRGYIDTNGKVIVEPKYSWVELVKGAELIRTEGPACLYNFNGDLLINDVFSVQQTCHDGMLLISSNGNSGGYFFVDSTGKKKLKKFYDVREFSGGYAVALIRDEVKGNQPCYIDSDGNQYIVGKYENLKNFRNGYAIVSSQDNKKGIIDKMFKEIIPPAYDEISGLDFHNRDILFFNDFFEVKKDDKIALINTKGEIIVPFGTYFRFEMRGSNNVIEASTYNRYEHRDQMGKINSTGYTRVLIDLSGKRLTEFEYEFINNFYQGFAAVNRDGKNGFVNEKGEEVIPSIYKFDDIVGEGVNKEFVELGVIRVKKDGKWGLLDRKGDLIVPYIYDKIDAFNENVAVVKQNNRYGAINTYGEMIVPTQYFRESITGKFNGGRLGVRKTTTEGIKAGYINKEGELVIPYVFDKVYPFMKVSFN